MIFLQKLSASASHHNLARTSNGIKHKIEMLGFTKIRGFYQETFVSLKLIFSENQWKVLEYECCTETKDFLQLRTAHDVSTFLLFQNRNLMSKFSVWNFLSQVLPSLTANSATTLSLNLPDSSQNLVLFKIQLWWILEDLLFS